MRSVLAGLGVSALLVSIAACGSSDSTDPPDGTSSGSTPVGSSGSSGGTSGTSGTSGGTSGTSGASGTTPPAPPSQKVRFVAMGDTGENNASQQKVANAIAAKCKAAGCDFVQLLGDNLYDSGASSVDDPIWQTHFETPYTAIDLPFYAVLGNHDYGHNGLGTDSRRGRTRSTTRRSRRSGRCRRPTTTGPRSTWSSSGSTRT